MQIHNTVGKSEDFSPVLSKLFPQEKQIKIGWEHPIFNQSYKFPEDFPCLQQLYKNAPPVWGIIKEERLCIFYEEFKTEAVQKQNGETFNIQPVSEEIRKIEANIVLKLCEYKGYSAIYAVIDYGFENSDVWEQTSKAWLNIKNSQTPEALPEATLGVTVTGKGLPDPILTVCSFYPDIFDLF